MTQFNKNNRQQIKDLIELNDDLENYFRNTIIPQLFVDADLILRKYTPPAMKQFRFTSDCIGRPMEELIDNIRFSTITENISEVITSGEILEKEIQTTDSKWYQMNIIPYLIKKDNKPNGVIITFVDITDRIRDLRELERLNAAHETFIYSVSHDLKAPLSNIEALVKYLLQTSEELSKTTTVDNKEQKNIAGMLNDSVLSMRKIINELSEIVKIEKNYKEVIETISFNSILKEVEMTLKDKIIESKAHIITDIKETKIQFSRKSLRSIIYNLLSNAIKFKSSSRAPEIFIKTEKQKENENEFVKITVKDNGLGIAAEKKDLVFTPFTRLEKETEGTGIGLYLVKKIVENQGGKISINSKPDEGSEFIVYLKNAL
jgi:two-component system, OmpR family, phosphate regulon sensor histidine kinase PhoR